MVSNGTSPTRVLITLVGDVINDSQARIKYGTLIEAIRKRFQVVGIYNASLRGADHWMNLMASWHPERGKWRERAMKSLFAFRARSRRVARWTYSLQGQAEVILQLGVLFDAGWGGIPMRQIIYTDYTAQLSSQRTQSGRSPLKGKALQKWLELENAAMLHAQHIFVRSQFVQQSIVSDYRVALQHVSVIGGGVNLETLPILDLSRKSSASPVVLFIGSDFYRKGGDLVLQAFARVRGQCPDARLLLLTRGPIPDGIPLEGVQVIPPTWQRNSLLDLYRQADIFVMPSRLETWGDVFLEAMAFGLPCIGVHGQSMGEIIRSAETGLLVTPGEVSPLADAMIDLCSNPEKRRQMGHAGRRFVEQEFTWDRVVDRMAPVINPADNSSG